MPTPEPAIEGTTFCRECGKPIEADARFCRFCGKSQADRSMATTGPAPLTGKPASAAANRPPAAANRSRAGAADGLEQALRQLFPRHHLQDEFMHIGSIAAFFMALIGFVLGFFSPAIGGSWLSTDFLLGSIALILFLILRESTLSHIRARGGVDPGAAASGGRYHAARQPVGSDSPPEAATPQSSPAARPTAPAPPRPSSPRQ